MMTKTQFIINNIGLIVGLSLVMFVVGYAASEWTPPTDVPPKANTATPLNVGNIPQFKNGNLGADLMTVFGGYAYKTKLGLSTKCASGQGLGGLEVSGGIITDGTCGAAAGGGGASTKEMVQATSYGQLTTATCPAGKKLTGGGCNIYPGASGNVFADCRLLRNGPASDSAWQCQWKFRNGSGDCGESGMMQTFAICE